MSTTPPIQYSGPVISPSVEQETRRHLQLIYQKLGNHTQAFSLQQQQIATLKAGSSTTTVIEGGSGGGGGTTTATGVSVNDQSGQTSYSTMSGDNNALIVFSDASPIAVTLNTQTPPWSCFVFNLGSGAVTLTPFSGAIDGGATFVILQNYMAVVAFDGENWFAGGAQLSFADISGIAQVAQGGTGTSTPSLVEGTNITITGSWPDQTINASTTGLSVTITTAQLTPTGTQGSMTFSSGLLVSQVQAT